jgi:Ca-activated chloride channel family protein
MKRLATCAALLVSMAAFGCRPRERSAPSGGASEPSHPADQTVNLTFTYGSEKEDWIKNVTAAFNQEDHKTAAGKFIRVEAIPMGSGDLIDELVQGTRHADLASPASAAFIKLGNVESRTKTGKDLIGPTDNLVISPVVIAMWKPMAEALGWPAKPLGWSDILDRAADARGWGAYNHPEWGPFRFGHTSPESSNSGLISILAEAYAATGKKAGLTLQDVNDEKTAKFIAGIEQSVVHYGSSTGFFAKKMFSNGPQYLSAAVMYENMVIESYSPSYQVPFPVVAIYPKDGTFWSDHPVGIVNREWVTAEKRDAAKVYIDYLLAKPQQEKAIPYGFRPGSTDVAPAAPIDPAHGVDPREPKTTLEVPSTEVMDAVLKSWHVNKKHADVTLVFDTSGSMKEDHKIENARDGALQLVQNMSNDDLFSLLPFSNEPAIARSHESLRTARNDVQQSINGLYPSGGTALYDAIDMAYRDQMQRGGESAGRITAIVVLTDGADRDSRMKLDDLLNEIRFDNERRTIRVFTIAYGGDARKDVLARIADATQAKSYEGNPQNIRAILREISTFF